MLRSRCNRPAVHHNRAFDGEGALDLTGAARLQAEQAVALAGGFGPLVAAAQMAITFAAASIVPTAALALLMAPIVLNTVAQLNLCPCFPTILKHTRTAPHDGPNP